MIRIKAVILAAGNSRRMLSDVPKILHKICGKYMLDWVIDSCRESGINDILVVIGNGSELVKKNISDVNFCIQDKQLGTGHAVKCARDFFGDTDKNILILNGDMPLINSDTLKNFIHEAKQEDASLISTRIDNPTGYGRILKNKNNFEKIIEEKDANNNEKEINEINVGVYLFKTKILNQTLDFLNNYNSQSEYYLTDVFEILKSQKYRVKIFYHENNKEFFGVNDRYELSRIERMMREKINKNHMLNGVTIVNPDTSYIDFGVEINSDTVIMPNSFISGNTKIGKKCLIGPDTNIFSSRIFDNVEIYKSVVKESVIHNNVVIGPFSYIRPNCIIKENVKIGDFVEIKNSNIEKKTKISHLTYIGDSDVGENVNFGCGCVTANYDGKNKNKTIIENDVFVGCNANLIAPIEIKRNSYIAAGSTIDKNIPENTLAIARAVQINKLDYDFKNKNKKIQ
ncbi:MAG: bifunctional UDP-N-acetylglucosamine diphosphorylase/glucosamine-1-phosphate N-acetyltransferase GlmU [Clostridiales bacterium]|nr:bifunctional UDP-N-acetylglucosamine diphosphorylase/glucosamine-1-phosphate N-acetyltransferase GlmU [Clostridiales bacterium]